MFKAAHQYYSSPSCFGRLLSEVGALKIESPLCVDAEGKEGRENSDNAAFECYSCALEKPTSMKQGGRRREKKRKGDMKKLLSLCLFLMLRC